MFKRRVKKELCSCTALLIFIALFSSCGQKQQKKVASLHELSEKQIIQKQESIDQKNLVSKQKKEIKKLTEEQRLLNDIERARRSDIPVPVNYTLLGVEKFDAKRTCFLSYEGNLPLNNLHAFYIREMERLGWNIIDFSCEKEGLLVCDNVAKYCSVSMRKKNKKKTHVYVVIRPKHEEAAKIVLDVNQQPLPSDVGMQTR